MHTETRVVSDLKPVIIDGKNCWEASEVDHIILRIFYSLDEDDRIIIENDFKYATVYNAKLTKKKGTIGGHFRDRINYGEYSVIVADGKEKKHWWSRFWGNKK